MKGPRILQARRTVLGLLLVGQTTTVSIDAQASGLSVSGRIITGWTYESRRGTNEPSREKHKLFLAQSRLNVQFSRRRELRIKLSADLADGLDGSKEEEATQYIRDAWLRYRIARRFRIRAGRFKRPMSRLQLMSGGELPFRGRGDGNSLLLEDLGYGDRGVGFEVESRRPGSGRFGAPKIDAHVSVTAPSGQEETVDIHGRLQLNWGLFSFGAGLAQKFVPEQQEQSRRWLEGTAYNADLQLKWGHFELLLDAIVGRDLRQGYEQESGYSVRPLAAAVVGYFSLTAPVGTDVALQPVVFGEWVDRDIDYAESESLRGVLGVNLLSRNRALRLMAQVAVRRPQGRNGFREWRHGETYTLSVSGEL